MNALVDEGADPFWPVMTSKDLEGQIVASQAEVLLRADSSQDGDGSELLVCLSSDAAVGVFAESVDTWRSEPIERLDVIVWVLKRMLPEMNAAEPRTGRIDIPANLLDLAVGLAGEDLPGGRAALARAGVPQDVSNDLLDTFRLRSSHGALVAFSRQGEGDEVEPIAGFISWVFGRNGHLWVAVHRPGLDVRLARCGATDLGAAVAEFLAQAGIADVRKFRLPTT